VSCRLLSGHGHLAGLPERAGAPRRAGPPLCPGGWGVPGNNDASPPIDLNLPSRRCGATFCGAHA
jgi:hypothetical protein